MNTRWIRIVGLVSVLGMGSLGTGCFGSGGSDDDDHGSADSGSSEGSASDTSDPTAGTGASVDLDECRGAATNAELDDTIVIVDDYNQSLHEMVVCGGLAVSLVTAVVDGIFDAIVAGSNNALPDDWSYEGEGVYLTGGGMASMQMRFYLAEDFEYGAAGDLVTDNLFVVDSYLRGAVLDIDILRGTAEIRYDEPGPLVELLGFGANPPNPLPVDINDIGSINSKLRALDFEGEIAVDDNQNSSIVRYHLDIPRMSAGDLLSGAGMSYELDMADATRDELDQRLTVDDWAVEFVNGNIGALDGTIDFHVDGRHFPFKGTMVYESSSFAEPQLSCP